MSDNVAPRPVYPQRVVEWLHWRNGEEKTVCVIEPDEEKATKWMLEAVKLIDELKADKYSRSLKDGTITIEWKYGGPEHTIRVYRSYEAACKDVFDDVCIADHFNIGGINV